MNKQFYKLLNDQISMEISSAHIYLNMSAYLEDQGLDGMAHWMYVQHIEELDHAMKLYHHLLDRNMVPKINALEKPMSDFESVQDVWEKGLEHEKQITASFHNIMKSLMENAEFMSLSTIQWYLDEQVEEENNFSGILDKIKYSNESKDAILSLSNSLGGRVYNPLPGGLLPTAGGAA